MTCISLIIGLLLIKNFRNIEDEGFKFAYRLCIGFTLLGGFGCGLLGIILKSYNLLGNSW